MAYVTSVERLAEKRGLEKGMGEGVIKGELNVLERQLAKRFGPLPVDVQERLRKATCEQLETWAERVLDAATLQSVFEDH